LSGSHGRGDNVNYFDVYREIWNFHKRHSKVLDTDAYWDSVTGQAHAIARKYGCHPFVGDLLKAVIEELERTAKELRNKDGQGAGGQRAKPRTQIDI